jgi:Fe-S cluster biosynthesis and repair protein YggX
MCITCSRCSQASEAMAQPPMPTALGAEVQKQVCLACWREWLSAQVMLINEYRLNLIDPDARKALEGQMRTFLKLTPSKGE